MFSFTFYVKCFYALIFCIMHAEGVRVRIPPLINLPSSRLLYARQEGLREGASYDPRPNLLRSG